MFFNSDMKELPCCYLLSFPKSASESHTKLRLTFVPARPERVKTGNQQHLFGALHIPLLRAEDKDGICSLEGLRGCGRCHPRLEKLPRGGLTSGAMRRVGLS